ncbi:hypothetical protein ACVDG5_022335 [Mesorhizobium sp. ORM6]
MTAERLKVRDVGDGYEVLDYDGKPIAICATIVYAARYVRGFAARFRLDWVRAADPSTPSDYCASFLGSEYIGRIRAESGFRYAGHWAWWISTNDPRWRKPGGQRGREAGKDLAMVRLEHEFTCYLANTPDGLSPYALVKGLE